MQSRSFRFAVICSVSISLIALLAFVVAPWLFELRERAADAQALEQLKQYGVLLEGDNDMPPLGMKFRDRPTDAFKVARIMWSDPVSEALPLLIHFRELEGVALDYSTLTDADFAHLGRCKHLKWLTCRGTKISGSGLGELRGGSIESLTLDGSTVTDAGLETLSQLPTLRSIGLRKTNISDAAMNVIGGMTQLEALSVAETSITDAGIQPLRQLRHLTYLDFERTQITDSACETLAELPELEGLILSDTKVSDLGIARLSRLGRLRRLEVSGTNVSDACIADLKKIPTLSRLYMGGTRVTRAGMTVLNQWRHWDELSPGPFDDEDPVTK